MQLLLPQPPPPPPPPSHSGPMSKVILKYDQYQISPHNTTARSHAQVTGNECNDQHWWDVFDVWTNSLKHYK